MEERDEPDRTATAYHEAGHAVIATIEGLGIETIRLSESEVRVVPPADLEDLRRTLDARIRAAAAGRDVQGTAVRRGLVDLKPGGEMRALMEASISGESDLAAIAGWLKAVGRDDDAGAVFEAAAAEVRGRLDDGSPVWTAIVDVARSLLDKGVLSPDEVRVLVQRSVR